METRTREEVEGIEVTRFRYFLPARAQRLAYGAGIPTNLRNDWRTRFQILPFAASFFGHMGKLIASSDVVHAHWIEPAFLALPWKGVYGKPLVVSVHRYNPGGRFGRALYRQVMERADVVMFNSTFTQDLCAKGLGSGYSTVIPPGIDIGRFPSKWQVEVDNVKQSRPRIFALGSLVPKKGFIHLVEAIPRVLSQVECEFVIGGQGPELEALRARATELGVHNVLTFLGRVPTTDVPRLMREAAVFVLPSILHVSGESETLGMVLVEALASGTPCVASETGGIPDVIEDGINGFLVPPGDSTLLAERIVMLLTDEKLRNSLGRNGRQKVERYFGLSVVAEHVLAVYEEALTQ